MKTKKYMAVILALGLLAASLSGCSQPENKDISTAAGQTGGTSDTLGGSEGGESVAMGRYVEQTRALPQLAEGESILDMVQGADGLLLFTFEAESESTGTYHVYTSQSDQTWVKEPAEWLNTAFGGREELIRKIRTGPEHSLYLWYFDDDYRSHILRSADGKQAEDMLIPDLKNDENMVCGFAVTGSGDVAIAYMGGSMSDQTVLYRASDGSELMRFRMGTVYTDNISGQMDAYGDKLALASEDGAGYTIYDTQSGQVLEELRTEASKSVIGMDTMIRIGRNDDYYYLSATGLSHARSGGSIWETLIDGSLNTIGMEGISYSALIQDEEQEFIILFTDLDEKQLANYSFDPDVPTVPATQLSVYGLTRNKAVSRAIGAYQKANPDVRVIYYTAQTQEGAVTVSDSIRTLNTELLGGKGADVLLLDGLPVESYIEKGVLEDISDIITPMCESGQLLQSLTESYKREDGSIYGVPVRFSIPVLVGDREVNEAFQSLDTLRQYAAAHMGTEFISLNYRTLTYEDLADLILTANYSEVIGTGGRLDRAKIIAFLETVKETGTAVGATIEWEAKPPATEADLKSIRQWQQENVSDKWFDFGIYANTDGMTQACEIKGVSDMMAPVTMQNDYGRTISGINHQYIPSGMIGINSASRYKNEAKEFLTCLLSEDEQSKDLGGGMPVNAAALDSYCENNEGYSSMMSYEVNGERITLSFRWPSKEDITAVIDLAKTLTVPLNIDRVFKEMILDEAVPYFEGRLTADQTADAILSKANTYLAE